MADTSDSMIKGLPKVIKELESSSPDDPTRQQLDTLRNALESHTGLTWNTSTYSTYKDGQLVDIPNCVSLTILEL
jgi:hypothetical protein